MKNSGIKSRLKIFLKAAEKSEKAAGKMYARLATKARKGGFDEIAKAFEATSKSEFAHEKLMKDLSAKLTKK